MSGPTRAEKRAAKSAKKAEDKELKKIEAQEKAIADEKAKADALEVEKEVEAEKAKADEIAKAEAAEMAEVSEQDQVFISLGLRKLLKKKINDWVRVRFEGMIGGTFRDGNIPHPDNPEWVFEGRNDRVYHMPVTTLKRIAASLEQPASHLIILGVGDPDPKNRSQG